MGNRQILILKESDQSREVLPMVGDLEGLGPARRPSNQNIMTLFGHIYRYREVIRTGMGGGHHRHTSYEG